MKLWETEKSENQVERAVIAFTVGEDYISDLKLVPWDCLASLAHGQMLLSIGVLTHTEFDELRLGINEILALHEQGTFLITQEDEDCHTAIERHLTERFGEVGKKIHTARSRNDQVLTALKLYMKNELLTLAARLLSFSRVAVQFGESNPVAFPGYTHLQKAMPSSVTLWSFSHAEAFLQDARLCLAISNLLDSSPLGSAAGYGVGIPINREQTAALLGFDRVERNVIAVQNNRGKNEFLVLSAIAATMTSLTKLATDLLFFSQGELGYFELPARFCTGSSIMPQKKNPDVLELMRAKGAATAAKVSEVLGIILSLPSGYHRDFQLTKGVLFQGAELVDAAIAILMTLLPEVVVNRERCEEALSPFVFAADIANTYVQQGLPFRDAYRKVKEELATLSVSDPYEFLAQKIHTGAPGNPGGAELKGEIDVVHGLVHGKTESFKAAMGRLIAQ